VTAGMRSPEWGIAWVPKGNAKETAETTSFIDSANHVADRIEPALLPNLAIEGSAAIALCCAFLVPGP
jgi:hypothetical protein